jgi:hypothetical protein
MFSGFYGRRNFQSQDYTSQVWIIRMPGLLDVGFKEFCCTSRAVIKKFSVTLSCLNYLHLLSSVTSLNNCVRINQTWS